MNPVVRTFPEMGAPDDPAQASAPRVTVRGAEEGLLFDAAQPLQSTVAIDFRATAWAGEPAFDVITWTVHAEAEPRPPREGAPADARLLRVRWRVACPDPDAPRRFQLTYVIRGASVDGEAVFASERDVLLVDDIALTDDPRLTRIMRHEFTTLGLASNREGTPEDEDYVFDPGPVQAFIDGLTPQQKCMLLNYDVSTHEGNRLVTLITLMPDEGLDMCADYCVEHLTQVIANASFAVVHCRGPGQGATLVSYTRYFVLNLYNGPTKTLLHSQQSKKPPREWLARDNPKPVMFKIGCCEPSTETHAALYNRVLRPDGTDVMPGNTVHGLINTIGCWMLFRNYNWPLTSRAKARGLYLGVFRPENYAIYKRIKPQRPTRWPRAEEAVRLQLEYQDRPMDKFLRGDRNLAFKWFFHEVVGVPYYAPDPYEHEVNVHGRLPLKALPDTMGVARLGNPGAADGYGGYDVKLRNEADHAAHGPRFKPADVQMMANALGFRTASRFLSWALQQPVPKAQVEPGTWCDLYLYADARVDLDGALTNYRPAYVAQRDAPAQDVVFP
jgi:hypothetical protein